MQKLKICIDPANHPIYIHCLDGRKITSLLVLLIRRLQGWTPYAALAEFWRHQLLFRSPILAAEIEKTTKELEFLAGDLNDIALPESIPKWLWGGDKSVTVAGVRFVNRSVK
mmetsp:Transcript_1196/g.1978  ORF Transcript_1196/g.1978 Transcript_1196/m.1978 type:complete len:112 (+) Transcript_1196:361-696(+)